MHLRSQNPHPHTMAFAVIKRLNFQSITRSQHREPNAYFIQDIEGMNATSSECLAVDDPADIILPASPLISSII